MELLAAVKSLVYTSGTIDLNKKHNKAVAHMNLMNLYQKSSEAFKISETNMYLYKRYVMSWTFMLVDVRVKQEIAQENLQKKRQLFMCCLNYSTPFSARC